MGLDELDVIGPYKISHKIGAGGFAVVYFGEHLETQQRVAVKVLKLNNPAVLASVRQEVEVLASLKEPGVVRVLENDLRGPQPWFSMEVIEGRQLAEYCALSSFSASTGSGEAAPGGTGQGVIPAPGDETAVLRPLDETPVPGLKAGSSGDPASSADPSDASSTGGPARSRSPEWLPNRISPRELARILNTVGRLCLTLDMLHSRGIVHRDLKPSNVMVRPDGSPVLVDFGLYLQAGDGRQTLMDKGVDGGSWPYMAPEMFRREPLDARADLYALGCLLYELLARRTPFQAGSEDTYSHLHQFVAPMPLSELVSGIPAELENLVERLLQKQREKRIGYASEVAMELFRLAGQAPPVKISLAPPYLFPAALAGRQDLLQMLLRVRDDLRLPITPTYSRTGLILLGGESGVGKTRLLNEFVRDSRASTFHIMVGGCVPLAAESAEALPLAEPLYPLRRAFQGQCDKCRSDAALAKHIFGARTPVLAPYIQDLYGIPGISAEPAPEPLSPDETALRLFMSLATTLELLCDEKPVILLLDDLQWADNLTLGFLSYLVRIRFFQYHQLMLVGTWRHEEPTDVLRNLEAQDGVLSRSLSRLNRPSVKAMIHDMLALEEVPEPFVNRLLGYSAGNPFFVAEYLRVAVAEQLIWRTREGWKLEFSASALEQDEARELSLPQALAALLERRLRTLSQAQLEMVQAAAVVGRECSVDLMERLCELNGWPFAHGLQQLLLRQILESVRPGVMRFVHDKLQERAYEMIPAELKRRLHRQVAESIEFYMAQTSPGEEPFSLTQPAPRTLLDMSGTMPPAYGALGRHWEAAGEPERARNAFKQDIKRAQDAEQQVETARLHQAWLQLATEQTLERLDMRVQLVMLHRRIWGARSEDSLRLTMLNLEEARAFGLPELEAECMTVQAELVRQRGDAALARKLNAQALAYYEGKSDPSGISRCLHLSALIHSSQGELQEAIQCHETAIQHVRALGDTNREAHYLVNLGHAYARRGDLEQGRSCWLRAFQLCQTMDDRVQEAHLQVNLCLLDYRSGDLNRAVSRTHRAIQLMQETETVRSLPSSLLQLAHLLELQGQVAEQASILAHIRRLEQRLDDGQGLEFLALARCQVEEQLGVLEGLEERARHTLELIKKRKNARLTGLQLYVLVGVLLRIGPPQRVLEECRRLSDEAMEQFQLARELDSSVLVCIRASLMELDFGGDLARAVKQLHVAVQLAGMARNDMLLSYALAVRGLVATQQGESGQEYLERAQKLLASMSLAPTSVIIKAVHALAEALSHTFYI